MAKQQYSFYRPHKRVTADNLKLDPKTGELVPLPSMTKQEFVRECDINNILKQYSATGMLTHVNQKAAQGVYADLPDPQDFQQSANLVLAAEASFASLPSKVRERFGNEPVRFLEFMADPENREEARKLGLLKPMAAEAPAVAPTGGDGGTPPSEPPKGAEAS